MKAHRGGVPEPLAVAEWRSSGQSRPRASADDSGRNVTSQPPLDQPSEPPCEACVSGQSRPRASADDSGRNVTLQPSLDRPSEPPCKALFQGRVLQRLVADYLWHQFVTDRDEAEESLFKYVAPLVPAEQRLIAAKGMLADHPLEKAELLRYTYSGEAKEGGDHGYRGSEADAVDSRNRDRQHEKDFGVHETPERVCGEFASAVRRECANDSTPRQLRRS